MSGRNSARAAARRAIGVPDATEIGEQLAHLQASIVATQVAVDTLRDQRNVDANELARLRDELARLQAVIVEQAAAIEQLQGQRTAGPGR